MQQSRSTTQEQIDAMRSEILRSKQRASQGKQERIPRERRRRVLKALEWGLFLCTATLLVIALIGVYTAKAHGETPALFGIYQLYTVETGSMEPTLTVGSVIICKKPKYPDRLAVDQIVTFRTLSGAVVTHRIIKVTTDESGNTVYRTKGDNPINSPDRELLTPDRVIGVFAAKIPLT